jgi:adenosylcobinamide-phosphate synthase
MLFSLLILVAIILDQLMGDPRWLPHPVKIIGNLCTWLETWSRRKITAPRDAGVITVFSVVCITICATFLAIKCAFMLSTFLGYTVSVVILFTTIAARDLVVHSQAVFSNLYPQINLEKARETVGMIVGRDTQELSEEGVSKACVETVAENMVDGVTAPLFYAVLGGCFSVWGVESIGFAAIGAMAYKAINTMDSMFGYKNEQYLYFGTAAARLDDIVNFIPSRLSGVVLVPTAAIMKLDWQETWQTFKNDRLAHASPNAGHPEAAIAGALGVQLGGDSTYFGKLVSKPTIGKRLRGIAPTDILITNKIMLVGSILFVLALLVVRLFFLFCIF